MANIPKKIPERRCVGCGEHFPKSALVRVVRRPEGDVVLDKTGKLSGRGAYLCPKAECLKKAQKAHRLETALSCGMPDEVFVGLEEALVRGDS